MENSEIKILIVDDEEHTRLGYAEVLKLEGYSVDSAENGREAFFKLQEMDFDVVVTDLRMPELDGMGLIDRIRQLKNNQKIIIITAFGTFKTYKQAKDAGVTLFLNKPVRAKDLKEAITQILKK
ncbi:response regulator [Calditerrivibrio nitroreducens]|uniref:Response regulator receiver protein n=1 Tax=Calditerrivibrio nitroreducens (strain DSM 19672 / NBRC 101217 / Yu37-1) TaxID=768670 RepID=E4TF05_CALNY|nr:response regulator [Calditerrivibrio nitroreducens]ADR19445.1 response regulator receiver protein [Calditerrivibrio nitroreducens DSM 19672]